MSYTGEDGRDVHFRLMQQVRPHWRILAIALRFPHHTIAIMENKDDPVYYLFNEWLRGANQENDPRPVTWRTLIKALRHANVQEEATVLEKHFIEISVTTPNSGEYYVHTMYISLIMQHMQKKGTCTILFSIKLLVCVYKHSRPRIMY